MKVDVIYFPKKCQHGEPMRVVQKFTGTWWYEAIDCSACDAIESAKQDKIDKETNAFLERLKARRASGTS